MSKSTTNFVVDAVAFAAFVLLGTTGAITRYVLPPGTGHFSSLWGLDRHDWGGVHFWIAVVFLITLALHLVLHWRWITCTVKGSSATGVGIESYACVYWIVPHSWISHCSLFQFGGGERRTTT